MLSTLPDWLVPTVALFPAMMLFFFVSGLGWAVTLLPRSDWQDRPLLVAVSMMIGPMLITTALFGIGTFGKWSTLNVLTATVSITLIGSIAAAIWLRRSNLTAENRPKMPITWLEMVLLVLIGIALVIRFWNAAYWPYANYDEFWVYGYNAKIFALSGSIPASMGYYPQLVPLSLTFGQVLWGGANEHVARVVVPYFGLASIVIVYVFAARLSGRRTGIIAAAVWTLYPHHAGWAQYADLEIPITFFFTGAAAFFIFAQRAAGADRARYAVIGGLFAAAALWTKPTAGALIESLGLIGAVITIRALALSGTLNSRLRSAFQAGWHSPLIVFTVALVPIGGMWYVRNILYGHPPLVLPRSYWQEAAQQSGAELGWPILLLVCTALYTWRWLDSRRRIALTAGLLVIMAVAARSAAALPNPTRFMWWEYALIGGGVLLSVRSMWVLWTLQPARTHTVVYLIGAFLLPYFVTWFWSYSYHFRLSFAIVPLFIIPIAILAERIIVPAITQNRVRLAVVSLALIALAIPAYSESSSGVKFALAGTLPDDHAKQAISNPALLKLVDFLSEKKSALGHPLRVIAPEELRLPFFFPFDEMRVTEFPTRLAEIADVDFFIESSVGQRLYLYYGKFSYNQILASLTRPEAVQRVFTTDDTYFRFSAYTVTDAARFRRLESATHPELKIGAFAELDGAEVSLIRGGPGSRVFLTLIWKALSPAPLDYSVFIHLISQETGKLAGAWGGEPVSAAFNVWRGVDGGRFSAPYHTRLWETGEYIRDEWSFEITDTMTPGVYDLRIGLFDPIGGARLPIWARSLPIGDSFKFADFTVLAK